MTASRTLWVGTRAGLWRFEEQQGAWERAGPFLSSQDVSAVACGPDNIVLAGSHSGALFRSTDGGTQWQPVAFDPKQAELNAYYAAYQSPISPSGTRETGIWSLAFAPAAPDTVYAGVLPAGLFRSRDSGLTWEEVAGLRRMPASQEFWGPFGAPFLHTILPDTTCPESLTIGISVGGVFGTSDEGETWEVLTEGMDPWYPDGARFPAVHKDVHKLKAAPADPARLYITEHGPWISRSDDAGRNWRRLPAGHARTVTRPLALHPRDPDRLWLALLEDAADHEDIPRVRTRLEVLESHDGGLSWHDRSAGLPTVDCNIYREGFVADASTPTNLYLGTSAGAVFHTTEDGVAWQVLADGLPSIRVVLPV
jgi:photosystem II stability/assembly factor-like uncharacterized protein